MIFDYGLCHGPLILKSGSMQSSSFCTAVASTPPHHGYLELLGHGFLNYGIGKDTDVAAAIIFPASTTKNLKSKFRDRKDTVILTKPEKKKVILW